MHGFYGTLIHVDLSKAAVEREDLPHDLLRETLGGKGLAVELLLRHVPPGADPLGPDNCVVIAGGAATGSPVWGSCRHGIYAKSPQTGLFAESYSGGTVAERMAGAGVDAVLIRGGAEKPVWIEIGEAGCFLHDASDLWGRDTFETEDRVKEWIRKNRPDAGKPGVLTIGPAAENGVAFAVVENDYWRSAGRTGTGAVLGAKKVKAVAFWGKRAKEFADPELIKRFARDVAREGRENPGVKAYKSMGTSMLVDILNEAGGFPTRYWHKGRADHREGINASALHERCDVKPHACLKCFMACGRLSTVKAGRHQGLVVEGPEFETIYAFGGLCEVADIEEIAYLNDLCDRLGLDTITAGNLVGFTIEAVRRGAVDYDIDYGQVDRMAALLQDMAYRRGIGDVLARGIRHAAAQWGLEDLAIHVKGMEPAGYDPRVLKGMGLAYGTSDRGACHLRATFYKPELSGMVDPEMIRGKARIFCEWEDRLTVFDTLILCRFYRDLYQWDSLAEIIRGTAGLDLDTEGMRRIACRIKDQIRRFNIREGLTAEDDRLPVRFHTEPLPETGKVLTEEQMEIMLQEYYRERGWDENGTPPAAR
jgi:aldehyde:ferredoxin oxidoreductase